MRVPRLLAALFILSGMAGLIYESIWTRYLGLFVGHGAYAQIIVLVIYLGGMSLGALLAARRGDRIRNPLLGYAVAEAAVGIIGLAFHPIYLAVTGTAYEVWFPHLANTVWLQVLKWSVAGAMILPQSVLLGTTFPLMTAAVLRRAPKSPGATIALFYFANSFGAAIGGLVSGFFLVGALGLPGTVAAAAILNLAVAAAAYALSKSPSPREPSPRKQPAPAATESAKLTLEPGLARLLVLVSFGTAVASFIYEIGWIRMLSLVLGSATRSFEVMLSAFILGLALGSLWVRSRADRFRSPIEALGILQWAMGSLALATLPIYLMSFHWMSDAVSAFPHDEGGYRLFTLVRYGICLAVMLPATFCAGTTLPLLTRVLMTSGVGERAIGLVYGVNTLGSILGAAMAGLVLLPLLGLKGLLIAGALVDVALGIALLRFAGRTSERAVRYGRIAASATAAVVIVVALLVRFDPLLLTSGVYRSGMLADPEGVRILTYRDGRTASVSVEEYTHSQSMTLSTNGKGDASLRSLWLQPPGQRQPTTFQQDESTQALTGLVPLAFVPRAQEVAVVGHGSGMTGTYLLGSPHLKNLVTIEIEPEVIRASRRFLPANRPVFEDPRSHFVIDDAKAYFAANQKRYDLIISEPSNPWVSGVSGLFSNEYYHRIRGNLTPDGIFGQWLHVYESNDDLALSVIAAVHENFRHYQIFLINEGDLLMVATNRPEGLVPDWSVALYPDIAANLGNLPPFTPNLFEALRVGDRACFSPLVESGIRANSDYFPRLDLGAEKARFFGGSAKGLLHLHVDRFSFSVLAGGHRVTPIADFPVPVPAVPRQRDLSMSAALRRPPQGIAPAEIDPRLPTALQRRTHMQATLSAARGPEDWRAWVFEVANAEHEWHGGTAGVVDEGFYGLLGDYMARWSAPEEAVNAVGFLYQLASWRLAEAARLADPLIASAAQGKDWLPPPLLLDGAVGAKLLTGDREGAKRAFETLRPRAGRDLSDLRSRIVLAHLDATASR